MTIYYGIIKGAGGFFIWNKEWIEGPFYTEESAKRKAKKIAGQEEIIFVTSAYVLDR